MSLTASAACTWERAGAVAGRRSLYLARSHNGRPRLNANPAVDEAHHKVPPAGFKYLVTEMVCWATGGPQRYTGRTVVDSHRHLAITPREWEAFVDDFQQTLDKFKVPASEQAELRAIVQSTYSDIVVGKA